VPGLLTWDGGRYFGRIVGDLAALGYGVRWCVLGADDVGAPHRRKRLWILADAESKREREQDNPRRTEPRDNAWENPVGRCSWWSLDPADLPDTDSERRQQVTGSASSHEAADGGTGWHARQPDGDYKPASADQGRRGWWPTESRVGRVAHGVAHRVDRLSAIGNGQVPAVAAAAWRMLVGALPVVDQVIALPLDSVTPGPSPASALFA